MINILALQLRTVAHTIINLSCDNIIIINCVIKKDKIKSFF